MRRIRSTPKIGNGCNLPNSKIENVNHAAAASLLLATASPTWTKVEVSWLREIISNWGKLRSIIKEV